MMHRWWCLFPVFVVAFLARRYCERYEALGETWAHPFDDLLVRIKR